MNSMPPRQLTGPLIWQIRQWLQMPATTAPSRSWAGCLAISIAAMGPIATHAEQHAHQPSAPASETTATGQNSEDEGRERARLLERRQVLERQITAIMADATEQMAHQEKAQAEYDITQLALNEMPSIANRQRAEDARFAVLMAERRVRRKQRGLEPVTAERDAVNTRLDELDRATPTASASIQPDSQPLTNGVTGESHLGPQNRPSTEGAPQLQEPIAGAAARPVQSTAAMAPKTSDTPTSTEREEALQAARTAHQAALAEIARLKVQMAKQQKARATPVEPKTSKIADRQERSPASRNKPKRNHPPKASAARTRPAANSTGTIARREIPSSRARQQTAIAAAERAAAAQQHRSSAKSLHATMVTNGRNRYYELLGQTRTSGKKQKNDKLMRLETYQGDTLLRQTSHSLKPLGNGIYQAKSVIRSGSTQFVIDGKQWHHRIPARANKKPYVFLLDTRDPQKPELLLFAQGDIR